MINNDIKNMVDQDLKQCEEIYDYLYNLFFENDITGVEQDPDEFFDFILGLKSKYSSLINHFPDDIDLKELSETDEESCQYIIINYLKSVIKKLQTFRLMKYSEINNTSSNIVINNENINHNENKLNNQNISFQETIQKIENMSALTEKEIDEIVQKVNQLELIVNSSERKSKKWEKAKDIFKWVVDKGIDVAKVIIPLISTIE